MDTSELRVAARQIWDAALQRANPSNCIRPILSIKDRVLAVGNREFPLRGPGGCYWRR